MTDIELYDQQGRNITKAVDNLFDREKVRAALIATFPQACDWVDLDNLENDPAKPFIPDDVVDRLIEALTGKVGA